MGSAAGCLVSVLVGCGRGLISSSQLWQWGFPHGKRWGELGRGVGEDESSGVFIVLDSQSPRTRWLFGCCIEPKA